MERDKKAWLEEFGGKKNTSITHAAALSLLHQAALKEEAVTTSDTWNYYLTQIQAVLNNATHYKQQLAASLESPDLVNSDHVNYLRSQLFIVNSRIETLEAVINLPKQIIEFGDQARLELGNLGSEKIKTDA